MRRRASARSIFAVVAIGGVIFTGALAQAAGMPVKAPPSPGCVQAVDGVNGKLAGLGGSFANNSLYGAIGSLSTPLGCGYGLQIDATAASFDGRFLGAIGGHLFWRDPSRGLLGLYGSYAH